MLSSPLLYLSVCGLGASVILGMQARGFFLFWIALELNLVRFLMFNFFTSPNKESLVKYFIPQRAGSLLLLVFLFPNAGAAKRVRRDCFILVPLLLKLGYPPFHWWLIGFFQERRWRGVVAMRRLQKVLPLMVTVKVTRASLVAVIVLGLGVGSLGLFGQTTLRKILGYSSIIRVA